MWNPVFSEACVWERMVELLTPCRPFQIPSAWMWAVTQTLHVQRHRNRGICFSFVHRLNWVYQADEHRDLWGPRFLPSSGSAILWGLPFICVVGARSHPLWLEGERRWREPIMAYTPSTAVSWPHGTARWARSGMQFSTRHREQNSLMDN